MGVILFFVPLYAYVALRRYWEFYFIAGIYGVGSGVIFAFSRSLFADFIPSGYESQYFGFYEVTDRGTAWLGLSAD